MVALVGGTLVVLVAFFGGWKLMRDHGARTNPGRPLGSVIVRGDAGVRAVVAIDDSGERTPDKGGHRRLVRMTRIDAASGSAGEPRIVEDLEKCWAAARDWLWCKVAPTSYELVDATTLQTIGTALDIATASQLGRVVPGNTDALADGGVAFQLADGRFVRVDPLAAQGKLIDERALERVHPPADAGCGNQLARGGYAFTRETRAALVASSATRTTPVPADAPRFLDPSFVALPDPTLVLVVHRAAVDGTAYKLSRIDAGKVTWTADIGGCASAEVDGKRLVLATIDPHARALALDLATGAVAWTYGL